MSPPTVLIAGLGFMGGSLAAALTHAGWPVLLHHRRPEVATRAEELGYGTRADDLTAALIAADLAVVCTPVHAIVATVRAFAHAVARPVITDVGSVKGEICAELGELAHAGRFVGSHPMAGSHLQGLEHARSDLYRGCTTAITPVPGTPEPAVALVERLWTAVGSRTWRLAPHVHDAAVADASHLPHVLAAVAAAGLDEESAPLAASGFRDTTRIAAGSPQLWADILLHNRLAVATRVHAASERLRQLLIALEGGDTAAVTAWLAAGRDGRRLFEHAHHLDATRESNEE